MALGILHIGERLKEAAKKAIDKGSAFIDKNIRRIAEKTQEETREVLQNPQERQKRQLQEMEIPPEKKEILDRLFNPEIQKKKIRVINTKTGTVREFYNHTATGKVILKNLETGEKQVAPRELLEKDSFKIQFINSPDEKNTEKTKEKISDVENAMMIINDLKKDQFVQYDVLRLLRKQYDEKYQLPQFTGEMGQKRKQALQIVERLLTGRNGRLAPLIYQYLKTGTLEKPENHVFGIQDDREKKWVETKAENSFFDQTAEEKTAPLFGGGEKKAEWLEKKEVKIGNRTFQVDEIITYQKEENDREYQGVVLGTDRKGRLIIQKLGTAQKIAIPLPALHLVQSMPGNPLEKPDEQGRVILGRTSEVAFEAEKRKKNPERKKTGHSKGKGFSDDQRSMAA